MYYFFGGKLFSIITLIDTKTEKGSFFVCVVCRVSIAVAGGTVLLAHLKLCLHLLRSWHPVRETLSFVLFLCAWWTVLAFCFLTLRCLRCLHFLRSFFYLCTQCVILFIFTTRQFITYNHHNLIYHITISILHQSPLMCLAEPDRSMQSKLRMLRSGFISKYCAKEFASQLRVSKQNAATNILARFTTQTKKKKEQTKGFLGLGVKT